MIIYLHTGNIFVLTAILRRKRRLQFLSRIDLLLLNLAIADLMVNLNANIIHINQLQAILKCHLIIYRFVKVTFLMMPLEIVWAATVEWRGGDIMCRTMAFFRIFGLYLSGFCLVSLAIDR